MKKTSLLLGSMFVATAATQAAVYTYIPAIQGAAHISPLNGTKVTNVPGLVTVVVTNGFYMQDPDGDGNTATSDAVFVFTSSAPSVTVGQQVLVNGTVSEYRPASDSNNLTTTEITAPTVTVSTDKIFTHTSVTPTVIGKGGRVPPTQKIDSGSTANVENSLHAFKPDSNGIDFYESLESMLVTVNNAQAVGPTDSYGGIWVMGDKGAKATDTNSRGGITLVNGRRSTDFNPERIQLVPTLAGGATAAPMVDVGDVASSVTGVISYAYYNYELLYTTVPNFKAGGLKAQTSTVASANNRLRIATYNVENLDTNDSDGCDTDVADGRFTSLGKQIANSLNAPDILSIEEIQDNNGCTDTGVVDASTTISKLQTAITSAGGPSYSYAQINPVNDQDGGQLGGNIRQVLLYNANRVTFVNGTNGAGSSTQATAIASDNTGAATLTLSPGRVDPTNSAWTSSRKPLAAMFEFNSQRVLVISNHFNSKGGDQPLYGPNQPPAQSSQTQRDLQAQVEHDFVSSALTKYPSLPVVVLGDLNDFAFSTPLRILDGEVAGQQILTDLADALLSPTEVYSYIYQGNSQDLDHIYVSSVLLPSAQVQAVHLNSEFVTQTSDHDPVLASLVIGN